MRHQKRFNRELDDYLSYDKPNMKPKTLFNQFNELWDYLFSKEIPPNINDIKDTSAVLVIDQEETWWDKLKKILFLTYLRRKLEKKKKEREDEFD
ncbi:MAG: hypothetical protein GXP63_03400 [DPANN group archaeon]|nr:hypothetical protein [DPANN group archaeon]